MQIHKDLISIQKAPFNFRFGRILSGQRKLFLRAWKQSKRALPGPMPAACPSCLLGCSGRWEGSNRLPAPFQSSGKSRAPRRPLLGGHPAHLQKVQVPGVR